MHGAVAEPGIATTMHQARVSGWRTVALSHRRQRVERQVAALISLMYVSTATHLLSTAELVHMLKRAPARNLHEGITGVLLYNDGNFMQYLEGPTEGISRVYASIKAHPLHRGLIELRRERIAVRQFAEWSTSYCAVNSSDLSFPSAHEALLLENLAPQTGPVPMTRVLLSAFISQRFRP